MSALVLAMVDMRGQFIGIGVVLLIGVCVFRAVRSHSQDSSSRKSLPIVAFICGPATAVCWLLADAFIASPHDYISLSDYVETLLPILVIGVIGGAVGSTVLWISDRP